MQNLLSREEKAARLVADYYASDAFAYTRTLAQLRRGNCSFGNADEIIKSFGKRERH